MTGSPRVQTALAIAAVRTPGPSSRKRGHNPVRPGTVPAPRAADAAAQRALAALGEARQAPVGGPLGRAWPIHTDGPSSFHVVDLDDGGYALVVDDGAGVATLDEASAADLADAIRGWQMAAKAHAPAGRPRAQTIGMPNGAVHLLAGRATLHVEGVVLALGAASPEAIRSAIQAGAGSGQGRLLNPAETFKDRVRKEMAAADRARHAKAMTAIDASIAALRKARGYELAQARAACNLGVRDAFAASRQRFNAIVADARAERDAARAAALEGRHACRVENEAFLEPYQTRIRELEKQQDAERAFQRSLRRAERHHVVARTARASARERAAESDDEVRGNLPSELVPLFEQIKKHVRARPGMSRTEAVLQYAEDHPDEVLEATMSDADAAVRRLVASQYA